MLGEKGKQHLRESRKKGSASGALDYDRTLVTVRLPSGQLFEERREDCLFRHYVFADDTF